MARVRFGLFDFETSNGELQREGVPVRLQSQPAKVLALLIGGGGEIVTREALREALWGSETFVDFDRGLNFCVAQIRSALGDSAESPRYIRTVPKRGYQFIAPVSADVPIRPKKSPVVFVVLAAVAIALAIWFAWPTGRVRIAVARFDNETGNPELSSFADSLSDSVVETLTVAGAGRYGVIGNAAILREPRDQRDLLAISRSLGVQYIVLGQVQRTAGGIKTLVHLIRLPEQTHLWVSRMDCAEGDALARQSGLMHQISGEFPRRIVADIASPRPAKH